MYIRGMMKAIFVNILLLFMTLTMFSITWTVKQDNTGQFTSIQPAIQASANGDTVLVFPGTYYENINYNGKNLTIASLELITNNPAYRDSTTIDGNGSGSCVLVISHENNAMIYGFTITHGSGYQYSQNGALISIGGGFDIRYATNFRISNCIIKGNRASNGGGIYISEGTMSLKATNIINNYAAGSGGGMFFTLDTNCIFDSNNRCSIYENYAAGMNDIGASEAGNVINVILDTFTINPPTKYYANFVYNSQLNGGYFTFDILNAYRTEVNHDLYVSPIGNDNNDGLTLSSPLKTITKALHTIASDSLNIKTVYLAPGIYDSEMGQIYPLSIKAFVNLIGDSLSVPIILNQHYEETLSANYAPGVVIKNLIFEHGENHPNYVFLMRNCRYAKVSNITINSVQAISFAGIYMFNGEYDLDHITLNGLTSICLSGISFSYSYGSARNVKINDCHVTGDEDMPSDDILYARLDSTLVLENISITNCSVVSAENGIVSISYTLPGVAPTNPTLRMTNVLVANNATTTESPFFISMNSNNTSTITNCSFVHNNGGNSKFKISGRVNIYNCLFNNGSSYEINIRDTQIAGYTSNINFYNNLITGYPNSHYIHPSNNVTFNEYNFSANPCYAGTDLTDPMSYRLNYNSPCINAGTPDISGLYLPETDLYGNPRIYNGIVDIGCNEWNSTANLDNTTPTIDVNKISIYPNPFASNTKISYALDKATDVTLEVYNTKGQLIKKMVNSKQTKGEQLINWNGKDENGKPCSNGVYLLKLTKNHSKSLTKKVTVIK
jgi:hypothetical protein